MLFGRPEQIIHSLIQRAKNVTPPKAEKLESLIEYALAIKNVCATMEATNLNAHLNNPMLLNEFIHKLPPHLLLNWAIFAKNLQPATLLVFCEWLYDIAEAACSVTTLGVTSLPSEKKPPTIERRPENKQRAYLHTQTADVNDELMCERQEAAPRVMNECVVCGANHLIVNCDTFKSFQLSDRWDVLRRYNLCRHCLGKHPYSSCRVSSKVCGINDCVAKHHALLHNSARNNAVALTHHQSAKINSQPKRVLFRILPVKIYGPNKAVSTFAFLDGGSSITLLDESLANELELPGKTEQLCLRWTSDTTRVENNSRIVSLKVSGTSDGCHQHQLDNVRTVRNLGLPTQTCSPCVLSKEYPYLASLPLPSYHQARPQILIGMDNWSLGVPMKVHEGSAGQPIATKTRLGWSVHGPDGHNQNPGKNVISNIHLQEQSADNELHQLVKNYFSLENVGVKVPEHQIVSAEEKRAINILKNTCLHKEDDFEAGLLWKFDDVSLPNSLPMAQRRLHLLRKRIEKNEELRDQLNQQITNLVSKGYAKKLSTEELNIIHERVWYLPIFIIQNPNKPSKVRLVWDAASKCQGYSLNDFLLKGPDQLIPLTTILFGFRVGKFGVCGDIAEMFHQVRIREADKHVQRFLWYDSNDSENPRTFGAACSPCIAHFVKNQNALNFASTNPRIVEAILEHHYVDDFIDSVNTEQEALQLAKDVRLIHSRAGFHIRNWMSNSSMVRNTLSEIDERLPNKRMFGAKDEVVAEKVLGLYWCTSTDNFTFVLKFSRLKRNVLSGHIPPTKREVLRILMSIFDPLGFLSHFVVCIKILLQQIWRAGIDWDEELPENMRERWFQWTELLPKVADVRVPRCYSLLLSEPGVNIQLHTFTDASENAYAAVSYFRVQWQNNIDVTIVSAKAKVAPQRPISVPRLELQAAVLGARLAKYISTSHKFQISQQFFWTDSKTVLSWLRGDPRNYQQFVMFRIAEILDTSEAAEWRWLPSKLNIADKATKNKSAPEFNNESEWFGGPIFLREPHPNWPHTPAIDNTTEEVRPFVLHVSKAPNCNLVDTCRFSRWSGMYRSIAYSILYIKILSFKVKHKQPFPHIGLTSEIIQQAQSTLYRQAQATSYTEEISILKKSTSSKNYPLPRSSQLFKLTPFLDEDGVLRMRGRIALANCVGQDCKTPIILPRSHRITFLVVDAYHRRFHHCNHETVLNEIKQKFHISGLRVLLKLVRKNCQLCKILNARPVAPLMANLPMARMSAFCRPFTFVGVDYFGPILVTVGRRNEKRWGAIFTCLTIRAVHIELAHTRRGSPLKIFCDNGTNFRGAERELKEELQRLDLGRVACEFTTANTEWRFNPPAAPHMGGAWERLVRSIKDVLYRILPSHKVGDESLRCALAEVESTLNTRPLTHISLDASDDEALTPNHFLLGSSNGSKPPCDPSVIASRQNWKLSQIIANQFWEKWIKAYLPDLNKRGKWFDRVKPIERGDLVIIVDEQLPRNCWPKGIVIETVVAKDNQVRRATVQTSRGIFGTSRCKAGYLRRTKSNREDSREDIILINYWGEEKDFLAGRELMGYCPPTTPQ
ncbi:uncharacterized protein LOC129915080 [Episyrphus balteatus]|uniref:uncharacterized protein LOC129915080 n=1 Tax=Episyrphus balteatus TaxID=286459 RepID=UPI002486468A|nr:uncharacterized protein LOC129915080 [Episyrphus balteatus]